MRIKSKTTFNFENDPNRIFVGDLGFEQVIKYAYHLFLVYPNLRCVSAPDEHGEIMEVWNQ